MKVLIVALTARKPSTRLRILPLAEALRMRGHAVTLMDAPSAITAKLALPAMAARHDVVLLQKKLFPAPVVALLRRANPRLIFDVDDAVMFHELERGEPVTGVFFRRFAAIAAASRTVVAGNTFVAEFARAARAPQANDVAVLPTAVDTQRLTPKASHAARPGLVVGWIGTKGNLRQLVPLAEPLRSLVRAHPGTILQLVADATIEIPGVPIVAKPWRAAEEGDDLRAFDIGIMPLEDTLWNRGKGGYKLLQYMAAGLPTIASPVGINREIVSDGQNGCLAETANAWGARLLQLAQDAALRNRMGHAARATVEARFSLSGYLDRYVDLIESCYR